MYKILTISFFLIVTITYSQHTDRFKQFTASIKPIDSINIDLKYRDGNPKEIGLIKVYQHGDYEYEFFSGKRTCYYKSGEIKSIEVFDSFGNLINAQLYDFEGYPYCSKQVLKIDTLAKDLDAFFESDKDLLVSMHFKKYRLSLTPVKWFLLEEGNTLNDVKVGQWKRYNKDGTIKKITNH